MRAFNDFAPQRSLNMAYIDSDPREETALRTTRIKGEQQCEASSLQTTQSSECSSVVCSSLEAPTQTPLSDVKLDSASRAAQETLNLRPLLRFSTARVSLAVHLVIFFGWELMLYTQPRSFRYYSAASSVLRGSMRATLLGQGTTT